ncbi:MAG: hypothetical protein IT370_08100 [Deltaproteobacteria bacterium]|nr:hypothetical protein [Deltaproteobacteria bacterium]
MAALAGCRELAGIRDLGPDGGARVEVEVVIEGGAPGHVRVTPLSGGAVFECPPDCRIRVPVGISVGLDAAPHNGEGSLFAGWMSANCAGSKATCVFAPEHDQQVSARFIHADHNIIFVTSDEVPANLGGLAPYDAHCNAMAAQGGINGVDGRDFFAWLSTPDVVAIDRLQGARGFIRSDGRPVSNDLTDPAAGIIYPIIMDERGGEIGREEIMTATTARGTPSRGCAAFTSDDQNESAEAGSFGAGAALWTSGAHADCALTYSIYCVSRGKSMPLAELPRAGKLVFLSSVSFRPAQGTSGADALCQAERPASHAGASFRALLATSTTPATRWLVPGDVYQRVDGSRVGTGEAFGKGQLDTGIWQMASGAYVTDLRAVATGGPPEGSPADGAGETCTDWSSSLGDHAPGVAGPLRRWWSWAKTSCDQPVSVYCVQQ